MSVVDNGGLDALTAALSAYLDELNDCHAICLRHEAFVTVQETVHGVWVGRTFSWHETLVESLRSNVERLPGWEETPFWPTEGGCWTGLLRRLRTAAPGATGTRHLLLRGLGWRGRALLAHAQSFREATQIRVELLLPPLPVVFADLPLRTVSLALRCHEFLVPQSVATPLRPPPGAGEAVFTLSEYLTRAMPENLFASQCFSQPRAEQSTLHGGSHGS